MSEHNNKRAKYVHCKVTKSNFNTILACLSFRRLFFRNRSDGGTSHSAMLSITSLQC